MNVVNNMTKTVALAVAVVAAARAKADIPRLDSSQFDYKYEMDALTTAVDVDNSGAVDFTASDPTKFTLGTGGNAGTILIDASDGGKYLMSAGARGSDGDAWLAMGATSATGGSGYTIETLLKIESQVANTTYALNLQASTADSYLNAFLNFKTTGIYWGGTSLTNLDTTVWHTYRIVREGSGEVNKFSVYVDGTLVRDGLGNGFNFNGLNRVIIGSPGGDHKGRARVAYLRMSQGAYAPPAAPSGKTAKKWSGKFPVQYEMLSGDSRFNGPVAGGTDWSGSVGAGASVSQNGILATTAEGTTAWWKANDSIWSASIGPDTAYTVEFRTKVKSRWSGTENGRDLAFQFWAGNPRNAAIFYVGASHVYWEPSGIGSITNLCDTIRTGEWHTYRLEYSGASQYSQPYAYSLWLDDSVIGTALKASTTYFTEASGNNNIMRFGVVSSKTHGGSFDIDYIRWTTDGEWDYRGPPEAFFMVVR